MLRTLVLLVAALAAIALAAPAPKPHRGVSGKASDGSRNFKSFSRGRHSKGHARNPRTELMRVYNKYHWSITLSPLDDSSSWLFDWPSSSSSGGGSDPYGSSPSEPIETAPAASPYGYGPQSSFATAAASGMATASAASPDGYGTVAPVAPSAVMSSVGFETRTSASFAASATASISGGDGGDDSGEVTASPEENESEYLSPVSIAGQKLNLNFDTGSADLWVFSTSLSERQRGQHSAFDPTKSSTWQEYSGGSWEISYGDGSGAAGTVGFDQVDVGGVTATQQAVELATAISSAFVSDENNDGLLGLAFGKINTVQPQAQKTFFENVADELDEKLFTADLDIDASGTYEFGKLDTSKYSGELHTTPIDNSRGFWEFTSNTYSIDGQDTQNSNASPAIADTGTSLIMVDENVAEAYYSQIQGAQMDQSAGGYVYPCDAQVPSFGVQIGEGGFMAHLNGSDIEYARIGSNTCFGGVQGNGGQGLQIYGAVLLKQYFAVFNFGDETFGIAQKN